MTGAVNKGRQMPLTIRDTHISRESYQHLFIADPEGQLIKNHQPTPANANRRYFNESISNIK